MEIRACKTIVAACLVSLVLPLLLGCKSSLFFLSCGKDILTLLFEVQQK